MPNKDNTGGMGFIIIIFILIILGTIFASTIADSIRTLTEAESVSNESVTVTAAGRLATGVINNDTTYTLSRANITGISEARTGNGTILTVDLDFVRNTTISQATVQFVDSGLMSEYTNYTNETNFDYSFTQADYIENSIARTILRNFVVLFFVLGFVIFIAGVIYKRINESSW